MLRGKKQLQARLHAIGQTDKMLRDVQIHGVREAKLKVHRRTSNLGRTIRPGTVTRNTCSILAGGTRNVGYAIVEEMGHKAYDIVPRKAKALAWGGNRTLSGRLRAGARPTHFARKVHIRAFPGHPYLVPSLKKAAEKRIGVVIVTLWNGAA